MSSLKVAIIAMAALLAGCDRYEAPQRTTSNETADERIHSAQESLMRARVTLEEFPRLDLILRTTREFVILRQVELSDGPMDWKTQQDLAGARSRAAKVLPMVAQFSPMIRRIEDALLDLRGALYRTILADDLSPASRSSLGECRSLIGGLLDDLRLAQEVLNSPDSVDPQDSDYYAPDFQEALQTIERALNEAGNQGDMHEHAASTNRWQSF